MGFRRQLMRDLPLFLKALVFSTALICSCGIEWTVALPIALIRDKWELRATPFFLKKFEETMDDLAKISLSTGS